ncbi:MAG: NADH-quinone oxidoreductase subunit N, partial [Blastocatellia bacterium]
GVAFKIAAAPFHVWAPDAYEGAPTPVAAFMSVGVKAASFALLVRIFVDGLGTIRVSVDDGWPGWEVALGVLAAVAMTWGNLAALTQKNAKRLLAYSAVAHSGYALLGIVAGNRMGYTGLVLYLVVYVAMNLGAFGVLIALRRGTIDGDGIADFRGLAAKAPGMAALMTIFMLGLGGIPPTAGFVGKFYLFAALVEDGDKWLVALAALALVNTAISAYYYLLFVKEMYSDAGEEPVPALATSPGLVVAVVVSGVLTLAIGLYPQPVIAVSSAAAERLKVAPDTKPAATRAEERTRQSGREGPN